MKNCFMSVILMFTFMKISFLDVSLLTFRTFQCLLSCDFYCDITPNQLVNQRGPIIFLKLCVYFFLFKTKFNRIIYVNYYIFIIIRPTYIIYFDALRFAMYN